MGLFSWILYLLVAAALLSVLGGLIVFIFYASLAIGAVMIVAFLCFLIVFGIKEYFTKPKPNPP
jgi:hypothetical protein